MPKFRVKVRESETVTYEIEADSVERAKEMWAEGYNAEAECPHDISEVDRIGDDSVILDAWEES